jgi:Leucine-rich repeat (LRR) protein
MFDNKILRLQNLKVLDLSYNDLTSLPEELGMLSLDCLYVSHNKFGETPAQDPRWNWVSGLRLAKSLEVLDLSHNEVLLGILSCHVHCCTTVILVFGF